MKVGGSAHFHVFLVVADDVRLLQEEAHVVAQALHIVKFLRFLARGGEEVGQADPDETGDVVAVLIKLVVRFNAPFFHELCHAVPHPLADVFNHPLRARLNLNARRERL